MNPTYVRSILTRLNTASIHVANKNKDKFYPRLSKKVDDMSEDEIKTSIREMIHYLQAPEFSYVTFRHYK
jgi:hypothetical protein